MPEKGKVNFYFAMHVRPNPARQTACVCIALNKMSAADAELAELSFGSSFPSTNKAEQKDLSIPSKRQSNSVGEGETVIRLPNVN